MNAPAPSFAAALAFWFRLGWISFGGPAGQIAILHAELVERRRWVDEGAFLHGLNYCMLLPGPEAMQLATWLGWRLHGLRGGFAAGALFVLPSALLLAVLSALYVRHAQLPAVEGLLLGLQAAVLGLIVQALWRMGRRILRTPAALVIALAALLALAVFGLPFPLLVAIAAGCGLCIGRWRRHWLPAATHHPMAAADTQAVPRRVRVGRALGLAAALLIAWWLPILALGLVLGPDSTAFAQGLFFSKAALVTFGGAYAVLPYVAQQAVETHQWLTPEQMLVGLGLAESTPGPLIMVLEFVGFVGGWQHPDLASPLASALLCAAVTVWATFVPCFLFVLPVAPWIERLRDRPLLDGALAAITAAVVGVIANLALWFGWHLLADAEGPARLFILAVAVASFLALQRVGVAWVVLAAAAIGALIAP
ncbi:MAG TPA: chromate efflux transporter [Xanthomonadaceae bacterium]|nr:chromate efflux transporter [Xanthomonadaceae bacterium]